MKEATGELNMAVVVAICIAILAVFFFSFIWPILDNNFESTAQCSKAACDCSEESRVIENGIEYCTPCYIDGEEIDGMKCIFKG